MIPVKSILIHRAEGYSHECRPRTVDTLEQASSALASMAYTAPSDGSYHKTDFTITFANGNTYSGRIDLTRDAFAGYDLQRHMRRHLLYLRDSMRFPQVTRAEATDVLRTYLPCGCHFGSTCDQSHNPATCTCPQCRMASGRA